MIASNALCLYLYLQNQTRLGNIASNTACVFVFVFLSVFVYLLSRTRVERASGEEMIASIFIHGGNDCKAAAINTN